MTLTTPGSIGSGSVPVIPSEVAVVEDEVVGVVVCVVPSAKARLTGPATSASTTSNASFRAMCLYTGESPFRAQMCAARRLGIRSRKPAHHRSGHLCVAGIRGALRGHRICCGGAVRSAEPDASLFPLGVAARGRNPARMRSVGSAIRAIGRRSRGEVRKSDTKPLSDCGPGGPAGNVG